MLSFKNQMGFSIVEVVIAIAVVGIGGYVGYTAYSRLQDKNTNSSAQVITQSPVANDIAPAPTITTTDDLTAAEKILDNTNIDNPSDTAELDTELSTF